jgi:hypothetical protein
LATKQSRATTVGVEGASPNVGNLRKAAALDEMV